LQNGGGISAEIYFSTNKPVDRVHASVDRPGALGPPWTDGGTDKGGARARRRAHRSSASGRSGAPKLTGEGAKGRGEHEELGSGLTGARAVALRSGDGSGAMRSRETRWGGFLARERRGEGRGEVWSAPRVVGVAFIWLGEGSERGGQSKGRVNSH
jgi:hypothetical protein